MGLGKFTLLTSTAFLLLSACAELPIKMGDASSKTVATGSAGGANANNENTSLQKCEQPLGTMALQEEQNAWWYRMHDYGVQSTIPILRLLAQQSNCFVVVERGKGLRNIQQERALSESGELRSNSNFGKGQLVAADYLLTPSLTFSDNNTGGIGGALGGVFGSVGAVIGGSLKFSQASSVLTLVDNRSGVQVLAAEGSAKGSSIGGLLGLGGSKVGGALGSYAKTPEAKVIVAAMLDAFNNVIQASKNYTAQQTKGGLGTGGGLQVSGQSSRPSADQVVLEAQNKLASLGYNVGVADGVMGNKTRKAIKLYQNAQGLPVTGKVDKATLDMMRQN